MSEISFNSDVPSLLRLVNWFVPPAIRKDTERHRRAQIFILTTLILAPLSALVGTVFALVGGLPRFGATGFAVASVVALSQPFLLRRLPDKQRVLSNLLLAEILLVFTFQSSIDAGIRDPSVLIMIVVPWLAALLLGPLGGIYWSGVVAALLLGFYMLHQYGLAFPDPSPEAAHWWFQLIAGTLATALVGCMGYAYERRRAQMTEALRLQQEKDQQRAEDLAQEYGALIAKRSEALGQARHQARESEQRLNRMSRDIRQQIMRLAGTHTALAQVQHAGDGSPSDPEAPLDPEDPPCHDIVEKTIGEILRVLDSAEELSRLSADAPEVERQLVDLQELLEDFLEDMLQGYSPEDAAPTVFYEASSFELLVWSDPHHLRRALSLLAARAVRLYSDGEVTVSVGCEPAGHSQDGPEPTEQDSSGNEGGERLEAHLTLRPPSSSAQPVPARGFSAQDSHRSHHLDEEVPGREISDQDLDLELAARHAQLAGGALRMFQNAEHEVFVLSFSRCDL